MVAKDGGQTQINNLNKVENVEINKQFAEGIASKAERVIASLRPVILPLLPVLIFIFVVLMLSKLVYLLLGALIILFIARMNKMEMTYGYAYRIGLHSVSMVVILEFLILLGLPRVPMLGTIVFAIFTWINILSPQKISPVLAEAEAPEPSREYKNQ